MGPHMAFPRISLERMTPHTSNSHLLAYLMGALLIFAFVVWEVSHCEQAAGATPPTPRVRAITETHELTMLPPNIVPVQPTPVWACLADVIYRAPSSGRLSGELTEVRASRLASFIWEHVGVLTPYGMAGLARVESGFCTSAVSPSGRHMGLFQVLGAKAPHLIEFSVMEAAGKLGLWHRFCEKRCGPDPDHSVISHWFSGVQVNSKARVAAALVQRWEKRFAEACEGKSRAL